MADTSEYSHTGYYGLLGLKIGCFDNTDEKPVAIPLRRNVDHTIKRLNHWPEDIKKTQDVINTPTFLRDPAFRRPPFPRELYFAPTCRIALNKRKTAFSDEEDAVLLQWMIRAYPLMGRKAGKQLTSFQSPCLWHWAEQRGIVNRGWESMNNRCKTKLFAYICGKVPMPHALYALLENNPLFVFEDKTTRLMYYNRAEARRQNAESAQKCLTERLELQKALKPAPTVHPARRRKRINGLSQ